ncbi:hypothetical protein CCUS01_07220 [Colletotrichum cuscutae]|uniref:Uncharacterized protein n=1 Tax=Colletotrichum cuscutae TaxID=1209917 RepID=A0AAI9UZW0_9PEZI|nr:hypothetical protein CCUS01_07220 [Colletotrichum cuscutae]
MTLLLANILVWASSSQLICHSILPAFYYSGYGFLLIPSIGIVDSYGGKTEQYYTAFGLYLAGLFDILAIFLFFRCYSLRLTLSTVTMLNLSVLAGLADQKVANVIVYGGLELSYTLNCSANFLFASGNAAAGGTLAKIAGGYGFVATLSGFYVMAAEFCVSIDTNRPSS